MTTRSLNTGETNRRFGSIFLDSTINFFTAVAVVISFYAHAIFGIPSHLATPIVTVLIASGLLILALAGVISNQVWRSSGSLGRLSTSILFVGLFFCVLSTITGALQRPMSAPDIGVFVVQVATPPLLFFSRDRIGLLRAVCKVSVVFAFADLAANLLRILDIVNSAEVIGLGTSYGAHFLGIPGNSFAEGIVAFVAISYLAAGASEVSGYHRIFRLVMVAALFGSEVMIRARADLAISIVAVVSILSKNNAKLFVQPLIIAIFVSGALLSGTFQNVDVSHEERLRSEMMAIGLSRSKADVILGEGIRYRDTQDLVANYKSLSAGGVTESGTIDYAIAYGWLATICLYMSVCLTLYEFRKRPTYPSIVLACLFGAMVTTSNFENFYGSIVFFSALLICQSEEWNLSTARFRPL